MERDPARESQEVEGGTNLRGTTFLMDQQKSRPQGGLFALMGKYLSSEWFEGETGCHRARSLYMNALAVAEDKGDILAVRERLKDIENA